MASQLSWASAAKTGSNQPKVQLYVNTANPAEDSAYSWASWPKTSTPENPYGNCSGERTNNEACSWQYGWNRSAETERYFMEQAQVAGISTDTSKYVWWLDVETMNSWQSSNNDALIRNTAAIEGFAAYYQSKYAKVGLYSTGYQWGVITGNNIGENSNLRGLANWRPSGSTLTNAISNCKVAPLTTDGYISLTQYVQGGIDKNHSCI